MPTYQVCTYPCIWFKCVIWYFWYLNSQTLILQMVLKRAPEEQPIKSTCNLAPSDFWWTAKFSFQFSVCMFVNQKENLTLDQESLRALFHAPLHWSGSGSTSSACTNSQESRSPWRGTEQCRYLTTKFSLIPPGSYGSWKTWKVMEF